MIDKDKLLRIATFEAGLEKAYQNGEISKNQLKRGKAFYFNKRRDLGKNVRDAEEALRKLKK